MYTSCISHIVKTTNVEHGDYLHFGMVVPRSNVSQQLTYGIRDYPCIEGINDTQQLISQFGDNPSCIEEEGKVWIADNSIGKYTTLRVCVLYIY